MAGQQRPPLARIRVIDLTRARSGPTTARQFADWGADVIMVEARSLANDLTGDRQGSDFQNLHRNKRSIALDLKLEADRAIFLDLVATADVLLENFRPDVKRRLGIDYETLRLINPRLVYGSISGFGEDGPNALRPGVDQIAQGYGGLMSVTGLPGQGPIRSGFAVTDITAGLHVAIGCMVALLEREITGTGRWVRGSLLQSSIALLDFQATRWLVDGVVPEQEGNQHPTAVPMGAFETADGMVNIAAAGEAMFGRFCKIVGREAWLGDERFATNAARAINRDELLAEVTALVKLRSSDYWISELNAAGVACGPVNTVETLFADPQVRHLQPTRKVAAIGLGEMELLGPPFDIAGVDTPIRRPAPQRGEDSADIMRELASREPRQSWPIAASKIRPLGRE
jgi:crotonobetainyl-CoA:carnitine CoA-transferase CaiB-like acyl-CoA transferase